MNVTKENEEQEGMVDSRENPGVEWSQKALFKQMVSLIQFKKWGSLVSLYL